jgi:hypothetical protein
MKPQRDTYIIIGQFTAQVIDFAESKSQSKPDAVLYIPYIPHARCTSCPGALTQELYCRELTIPTKRPMLVGEVIANLCG